MSEDAKEKMTAWDVWMEGNEKERFSLVASGKRPLIALLLHPTLAAKQMMTAEAVNVFSLAEQNGFDGAEILYVYPERVRSMKDLPLVWDSAREQKNLALAAQHLTGLQSPQILLAYGDGVESKQWLAEAAKEMIGVMSLFSPDFLVAGITKKKHPQRILRLQNPELFSFDIRSYLSYHDWK